MEQLLRNELFEIMNSEGWAYSTPGAVHDYLLGRQDRYFDFCLDMRERHAAEKGEGSAEQEHLTGASIRNWKNISSNKSELISVIAFLTDCWAIRKYLDSSPASTSCNDGEWDDFIGVAESMIDALLFGVPVCDILA